MLAAAALLRTDLPKPQSSAYADAVRVVKGLFKVCLARARLPLPGVGVKVIAVETIMENVVLKFLFLLREFCSFHQRPKRFRVREEKMWLHYA